MLSHPLSVVALVGRYLTNKLMDHRPFPARHLAMPLLIPHDAEPHHRLLARISPGYGRGRGRLPMCYAPVCHSPVPNGTGAFDLHA